MSQDVNRPQPNLIYRRGLSQRGRRSFTESSLCFLFPKNSPPQILSFADLDAIACQYFTLVREFLCCWSHFSPKPVHLWLPAARRHHRLFPFRVSARPRYRGFQRGPEDRSMAERCIFAFHSVPPIQTLIENAMVQVLLTQDYALIHTERMHDSRIVPLDNRPVLPAHVKQFYGSSASPIFE